MLAHWFAVKAALDQGKEVPADVLAGHDAYYGGWLAEQAARQPMPELVQAVPVRVGRKTVDLRLPTQPTAVASQGGGKFQLRRAQNFSTGGFTTYEPGMVIYHGDQPLLVEKAGKPYATRHDGGIAGYYQDVDARPAAGEELAGVARLEAAAEVADLRHRINQAIIGGHGAEKVRQTIQQYHDAIARMGA